MAYNHTLLEQKWQNFWEKHDIFAVGENSEAPKKYILDMFPYPSGTGLHVGHPKGYTATDIIARYYTARGYNVLHPMGFDAFGLPAENFAIKTGTHPAMTTQKNVNIFIKQLKSIGFGYDWGRVIDTTDPQYYRWTQWIFLELFKRGLAYEQDLPINYCPSCKTGLANEEVLSDNTCERCGTFVERRAIRQWVLAITQYAERLLEDLDELDWTQGVKDMQRNWIGRSQGCEFRMKKAIRNKPKACIFGEHTSGVSGNWYFWLKEALESLGYDVVIPELSDLSLSNLGDHLESLRSLGTQMSEESLVIGHGLGAALAMRFVETLPRKIAKLLCVAPEGILTQVDQTEKAYQKISEYSVEHIKKQVGMWRVFLSTDDESVPYILLKKYFDTIGVAHRDIDAAGHFRSEDGYEQFPLLLEESSDSIDVYTTRIDTVFGMTYAVIAPDHPDTSKFINESECLSCQKYIQDAKNKSDIDRTGTKEKTGVFTGSFVINPFNNEEIPLYVGDYVLGSYGTGAVMAVPAHDERDFEFAKKYNIPIREVVSGGNELPFIDDGILVNSGELSGITSQEAREILTELAQNNNFGTKKINYKLRDWLFSRQRYWGEPIPLIHLAHADLKKLEHIHDISEASDPQKAYILKRSPTAEEAHNTATMCHAEVRELIIGKKVFSKIYDGLNTKIVIDTRLPLLLPEVEKYEPAGDGNSPLIHALDWVEVPLATNLIGKRETNTMPQWAGSCWYYLRFMDTKNAESFAGKKALDYWQNVDEYVGGTEHAVLHLLYARFWHKVLYDIGIVPTKEPFQKLVNQGMILAYAYENKHGGLIAVDLVEERDGKFYLKETQEEVKRIVAKMSKSLKNTVNPLDIVKKYGADTLRLYEMSIGDFRDTAPWNPEGIIGMRRFLDKIYATFVEGKNKTKDDIKAMKLLHKTIAKVENDIQEYKFNTAISAMIILLNEGIPKEAELAREWKEKFALLLHPFAPHMAEELWHHLGHITSLFGVTWPTYDAAMLVDDEITIAVQINGKLRGTFVFLNGVSQEEVTTIVYADPSLQKWLAGTTVIKEIFIPNKMFSIVVKN